MSLLLNNETISIVSFTVNKGLEKGLYNVVCYLEFYQDDSIEPYDRKPVSIDNLSEKDISFKELYKKLMELPEFE